MNAGNHLNRSRTSVLQNLKRSARKQTIPLTISNTVLLSAIVLQFKSLYNNVDPEITREEYQFPPHHVSKTICMQLENEANRIGIYLMTQQSSF